MKSRQFSCFILLLNIVFSSYCQEKNIKYFDSAWKETTKNKASYYRNLPLETKDDLVLIKDYYISGQLQFEGWAKKYDEGLFDGEAKWFFENGNLHMSGYYLFDERIGAFGLHGIYKEYHENGNIYKEENYNFGSQEDEAKYYDTDGKLINTCIYRYNLPYDGTTNCFSIYKEGELIEEKLYYENSNQLAYEYYNKENSVKERFYYKNGDTIRKIGLRYGYKKHKGYNITFYPSEKCGYVRSIKHLKTERKDLPEWNEFFYSPDGELKFKGKNDYGGPFEGTFYKENPNAGYDTDVLSFGESYKQQKLVNRKAYINDSLITDLNYIDGEPNDGTTIYYNNQGLFVITTLKKGYTNGKKSFYKKIDDIRKNKTLSYYYFENGKKEGESSVYSNYHKETYKAFFKDDKPYKGTIVDKQNNIFIYNKGKIIKEKRRVRFKDLIYFEVYENNLKIALEYYFYDDNGKEIESGIFKNGKPFNGYFLNTKVKILTLDYYKNGVKRNDLQLTLKENSSDEEIIISH